MSEGGAQVNCKHTFLCKCFRIEWVAYDLHSGVESLYWRIFDNYTGTDILHGHENLVTQRAVVSKIKTDIFLVHENLVTQRVVVSKIKTDILLVHENLVTESCGK